MNKIVVYWIHRSAIPVQVKEKKGMAARKKKENEKLKEGYVRLSNGRLRKKFRIDGKEYYVYGSDVKTCEAKVDEIKMRVKQKLLTKTSNLTLAQYYKEWQESRTGVVAKSTQRSNDERWARVKPMIGNKKLVEIDARDIREVQRILKNKKLTTTGVNNSIAVIDMLLRAAVKDRLIPYNPCDNVSNLKRIEPSAKDTIHRALTIEEQELFFEYARDSWYYTAFAFMMLTGCRLGEMAALQWSDIDYETNVIHITKTVSRESNRKYVIGPPKTASGKRDVALTAPIKQVLKQQRLYPVSPSDGRIFATSTGGLINSGILSTVLNNIRAKIKKETGIEMERFSTHAFRDTFATRAIEQGMKPEVLKKILGHSKLAITMDLYVHVLPNTLQDAMNDLVIAV